MYCPNCNMPRPNDAKFCRQCGTELLPPPKKKKGKLWPPIVFMAVMLAVGCVCFALTAPEDPQPSATPWFAVEDGVLSFDAEAYTGGPVLEIPATVDGKTVTALAQGCFQDCDELETVILPDTLQSIGDDAFLGCESLRGIKLTENVETIGQKAFYNCPSLEAVYIPESVNSVGKNAFSGCFNLEHVFFDGDQNDWAAIYPQNIGSNATIYQVSGPEADSYRVLE